MIIRRVNFNSPQLSHLKANRCYDKNLILKPAAHNRKSQHIDDMYLSMIRQKKQAANCLKVYEQWWEQIKRLQDEEKDIVIMFIEHAINRKFTPEEKIQLKKTIVV